MERRLSSSKETTGKLLYFYFGISRTVAIAVVSGTALFDYALENVALCHLENGAKRFRTTSAAPDGNKSVSQEQWSQFQ